MAPQPSAAAAPAQALQQQQQQPTSGASGGTPSSSGTSGEQPWGPPRRKRKFTPPGSGGAAAPDKQRVAAVLARFSAGLRYRSDGSGYSLPWDVRLRVATRPGGPRQPLDITRVRNPEEGAVAFDIGCAWRQLHPDVGDGAPRASLFNWPAEQYRADAELWGRLQACGSWPELRSLLAELRNSGQLASLAARLQGLPTQKEQQAAAAAADKRQQRHEKKAKKERRQQQQQEKEGEKEERQEPQAAQQGATAAAELLAGPAPQAAAAACQLQLPLLPLGALPVQAAAQAQWQQQQGEQQLLLLLQALQALPAALQALQAQGHHVQAASQALQALLATSEHGGSAEEGGPDLATQYTHALQRFSETNQRQQAELMILFLRGKHAASAAALASSMVQAAALRPA